MRTARLLAALFTVQFLLAAHIPVAQAQDICEDPANLTVNCQFDTFDQIVPYGDVANGWTPFIEFAVEGSPPSFEREDVESPAVPAQLIWSNGLPFTAGISQQVHVSPGVTYVAAIGWAPYASYDERGERNAGRFIGRRVGIDPLGGTDPTSPNIEWSTEVWDEEGGIFPQLMVSAVAQRQTMTVFVRAHNPQSHGNDKVFFDAVTLKADSSQPEATATPVPPSPTPTSPPPTATPTLMPPTQTPLPTDTVIPTSTATASPTDTTVPRATPSATFTATMMPSVTAELVANVAPAPTQRVETPTATPGGERDGREGDWVPVVLLGISVAAFAGAGTLGGVLFILRRP